jgi:hypothetical protein
VEEKSWTARGVEVAERVGGEVVEGEWSVGGVGGEVVEGERSVGGVGPGRWWRGWEENGGRDGVRQRVGRPAPRLQRLLVSW